MMEKVTRLRRVDIARNGIIHVELECLVQESGVVLADKRHRLAIAPGEPVSATLDAASTWMQDNLGFAGPDVKDRQMVEAVCASAQTSEVIDAYQAEQEARRQARTVLPSRQ